MKFKRIRLVNFMRYKGENVVEFSCDKDKNVTVVLGDNTAGKTTLAQAFRWVLYNEVINTQYEKSRDVELLNNDILGDMTANSHAKVEVELELVREQNGREIPYRFIRTATYIRKFPQFISKEQTNTLRVYVFDPETGKSIPHEKSEYRPSGKDGEIVDDLINEMLPKSLSSYFLFDGERWSDQKSVNNDIQNSIYNLVGISSVREMKRHLGDLAGRSSVIKDLQTKITGAGAEYESKRKAIDAAYNFISSREIEYSKAEENRVAYKEDAEKIEEILNSNQKVEQDQKECKALEQRIKKSEERMEIDYADLVTQFSKSAGYFAAPLSGKLFEILKHVNIEEGLDVPGIVRKTIDVLLKRGKCICGREIVAKSPEEELLNELKRVVPPATIGQYVGAFQSTMNSWIAQSEDIRDSIINKADDFQNEYDDWEDNKEELEKKQAKIDRKINFAEQRAKMKRYRDREYEEAEKARRAKKDIDEKREEIERLEKEIKDLDDKTAHNDEIRRCIAYAKALYEDVTHYYNDAEGSIREDLNQIIKINFGLMFNEKEKYPKLDDNYQLRLYYKSIGSSNEVVNIEATRLSEGEKIARNFAFIVSILELAKEKKRTTDFSSDSDTLPLVLDGPFSKLSSINTAKIAEVMPSIADQVIIFMLDKDWEVSRLSAYADSLHTYRIRKDAEMNSSTIIHEMEK